MNPISLVHLHKILLPSPRNDWSATGPRSKTQPTATRHTQRKLTRHGCWQLKPVRPVSETGQTTSVGLSLAQARETGLVWQIGQAGSVQKLPKDPSEKKPASRTSPLSNKNNHSTTETSLLRNSLRQPTGLNWSDRFGKPVRAVLAWTVGKNSTHGKNSNLQSIDLPIRSTDQSETLGIAGVPRGQTLARISVPKTHSIKRNQKSTLKNTFP
jgi:hypothetical protein